MTITYIPDFRLPITDLENRQTQDFNNWVRQVSDEINAGGGASGEYISVYWTDNTDVTDIVTEDIWVDIAGTMVEGLKTDGFIIIGTNTIGWSGSTTAFLLNMSIGSTDASSGFDPDYQLGYRINGTTQPANTVYTNQFTNPAVTSLTQIITLEDGDIFAPQVRDTTVAIDVTAESLNISLTSAA